MILARIACTAGVALVTGCFTADLDPSKEGAFACIEANDCPEGRMCINARCESEGPRVEITSPEDEELFDVMDAPANMPRTIGVRVSGELELAPPSDEHVSGEGHVAIFVDGVETTTIESGGLSGGITVMIEVPNRAGPHRVAAVARRNDGVVYDNPEARFTRLFWIDDGSPQVALKSPWPNTTFGLDDQVMIYSVTSLRIQLVPPMPESPIDPDRGHIHIYYDESFPGCLTDPMCDPGYIAIGDKRGEELMATIPKSAETTATLTAVLRNIDHSLYDFDPDGDGPMTPTPILDQITIVRQDVE